MKKLKIFCSMFVLLLFCAGSSRAALIFFDNFDSYNADVLPWPGEGNWTVTEDSVDLIGAGTAWDLIPGNGLYLDMDGSTGNAGTIESINIALAPGVYNLIFDIAGNQRAGADDSVNIQVSGLLNLTLADIHHDMSFMRFSIPFAVATATTATISFDGIGGDNVGALLDNVGIDSANAVKIPVPGAVLLSAVGIGFVGLLRRHRKL